MLVFQSLLVILCVSYIGDVKAVAIRCQRQAHSLVAKSLSHPVLGSLYGICGGMSSLLALKFFMSFLLFTVGTWAEIVFPVLRLQLSL